MTRTFIAVLFFICNASAHADESTPLLYTRTQIAVTRAAPPEPKTPELPWQKPAPTAPDVAFDVEVRDATSFYSQEGWFNLSSPSERGGVLLAFSAASVAPIVRSSQYVPLDVLMIDREGTITQIMPSLKMSELEEEIYPKEPVLAFLFLKGGACAALSIRPGDHVEYKLFKKPPTVLGIEPPAPPPNPLPTVKRRDDETRRAMSYWLVKSEPSAWSWDAQVKAGAKGTAWTGVRNHLAKQHLMAMKKGDRAFFYHSNEGKNIIGIVEVIREHYPDPTAAKGEPWVVVDVRAVAPLKKPVTLAAVKAEPKLAKMSLVTSARLSVQPVTAAEWGVVCGMGGG